MVAPSFVLGEHMYAAWPPRYVPSGRDARRVVDVSATLAAEHVSWVPFVPSRLPLIRQLPAQRNGSPISDRGRLPSHYYDGPITSLDGDMAVFATHAGGAVKRRLMLLNEADQAQKSPARLQPQQTVHQRHGGMMATAATSPTACEGQAADLPCCRRANRPNPRCMGSPCSRLLCWWPPRGGR